MHVARGGACIVDGSWFGDLEQEAPGFYKAHCMFRIQGLWFLDMMGRTVKGFSE